MEQDRCTSGSTDQTRAAKAAIRLSNAPRSPRLLGHLGRANLKRNRVPLPPIENRDWMTAWETGRSLGCSVATVHRLRRGLITNVPPLPAVPVGTRKFIFRKATVRRWQEDRETSSDA
jgi:hypothetical protein